LVEHNYYAKYFADGSGWWGVGYEESGVWRLEGIDRKNSG
jgi:hypothetical protein